MPQVDIKLVSSADMAGFSRIQAGLDQLGRTVQKKLEIQDIGKSFLNGLGLGSGFAVAEQAFTRWAAIFNEIAEGAKVVDAYVENIHKRADEISKMRFDNFLGGLNPDRQLAALTGKLADLDQKLEALQVRKNALYADMRTVGEAERGTISGSAFDPFGGRYGNFGTMRGVGDQIDALITKNDEEFTAREKERIALQRQVAAVQKTITDGKKKEADETAKASDQLDEAINKSAIAEAQAIEEAKAKSAASGAEILAQRQKAAETNAATTAIRTAQDAVEKYDTALARLDANPYLSDQEKQAERLRLLQAQTEAIKTQKQALDEFSAKYPGVDVGGLTAARDRLADKATTNATEAYKTGNRATLATNDAVALRGLNDPSQHYQDARGGAMGGIMSWLQQVGTLGDQVATNLASVFNSAASGISSSIMGLINRTMTWGQALANIGTTIIQGVIQGFANMVSQWIVKQIVMAVAGKAIQAAQVAALVPIAMATSAIWAVPATLATIATFGGAAAAAPAEILMAQMAVMGTSLAGFEKGGFPNGANAIVRVNENGQESILNARATSNLGSAAINALNSGQPLFPAVQSLTRPGFAQGGGVGGGASPGRSSGKPVHISFVDARNHNALEQLQRDPRHELEIVRIMQKNRGVLGIRT